HFAAGDRYLDQGDFARALEEYKRAYELAPHPRPLFNVAKMYELQGQLPEALEWYSRYLRESADGRDEEPYRRRAQTRVRALESTPAQISVACDLRDSTPLDKAEARVVLMSADGSTREVRCDQEVAVRAGRYRIAIRAPNYEPWERDLIARIGQPY